MSEKATTAEPAVAAPANLPVKRRGWHDWTEARQRFKDLLVVFFGVYAAFLLNRFESDHRDTQRRGQILDALEREVSANFEEMKQGLAGGEAEVAAFDRKLAAGEMPSLAISYNNSSYSPSDDATLLQAGGVDVLDVQTLDEVRKVNELRREFAASMRNQFELELTILGTHETGDFYDRETKQLKNHYAWYPVVLHHLIDDARTLLNGEEELLALIRSKRHAR